VLANLLSNARIHTPAGTTVTASVATRQAGADVRIHDDGPGIPEAEQRRVFERFARGDSGRARTSGSTGLGLAIVTAVVEAHGGAVTLESEPGSTTFSVVLPR
jgi:two-component system, OmpR family, sensor kinase